MMAVATEPPPQLRCGRCRSRLAADQNWCLNCGAAATTRVLAPPSWKLATLTVFSLVAVIAVGAVLLATSLSDDSEKTTSQRAAAAPAPPPSTPPTSPATPPAAGTPTPTETSPTPPPTTTTKKRPASLGGGGVQTWPSGKRGWTVVLGTDVDASAARTRAQGYISKGIKAGVLDANKYTFSTPTGAFVIFFGQFDSQSEAVSNSSDVADKLPATAYVTSVTPR